MIFYTYDLLFVGIASQTVIVGCSRKHKAQYKYEHPAIKKGRIADPNMYYKATRSKEDWCMHF